MFVTWNQLKPIISGSLWKKMMIWFSFDYENERESLIICRTSTLIDEGFQRVWHLLWANFIGNNIKMNVLHQEKCLKPENRLTQFSLDHFIWWCLRFRVFVLLTNISTYFFMFPLSIFIQIVRNLFLIMFCDVCWLCFASHNITSVMYLFVTGWIQGGLILKIWVYSEHFNGFHLCKVG